MTVTEQQVDETIAAIKATVYTTDSGMRFSAHPLYHTLWTHEDQDMPESTDNIAGPTWFRKVIKSKLEALGKAKEEERWGTYVFLHERPWRIVALMTLVQSGAFTESIDRRLVLDAWTDTESPHQFKQLWEKIFAQTTVPMLCSALTPDELRTRNGLPPKLRLYRGCSADIPDSVRGFSWTLKRKKAVWFAKRFDKKAPLLVSTVVPKTMAVGPLMGRGEHEMLVLAPNLLKDIREEKLK